MTRKQKTENEWRPARVTTVWLSTARSPDTGKEDGEFSRRTVEKRYRCEIRRRPGGFDYRYHNGETYVEYECTEYASDHFRLKWIQNPEAERAELHRSGDGRSLVGTFEYHESDESGLFVIHVPAGFFDD